jgi:septal ring factor EnvC (AmiA/AmiB activator)
MRSILNSFTALIFFTVAIWFFSAVAILYFIDDWSARGTFGDLFGAVNALFSGLAFAGLLFSLFENRKQIAQQQEELLVNRQELLKARKIQEKTEKAIEAQVAQMKNTARLSGLNTLVNYFTAKINDAKSTEEEVQSAKEKRREAIKEIDRLIKWANDDVF